MSRVSRMGSAEWKGIAAVNWRARDVLSFVCSYLLGAGAFAEEKVHSQMIQFCEQFASTQRGL